MKLEYFQSNRDRRLQADHNYAWANYNPIVAEAAEAAIAAALEAMKAGNDGAAEAAIEAADLAIEASRDPLIDGYPEKDATFFLGIAWLPSEVNQCGQYPTWACQHGVINLYFPLMHPAKGALCATIRQSMLKIENQKGKEFLFPLTALI